MYRGVDAVGYYRVDHVLDPRRKGKGQYFWRKAVVRHFYYYYYYYFSICRHNITTARKIRDVVGTIYEAVLHLPKPIRRVCIVSLHLLSKKRLAQPKKNGIARFQKVQIAAFMGWFPYLFYSTTYVAEVMAKEVHHKPDIDRATRAGSLALLIYSFGTCCVFVHHHPLPTPLKKKKKNQKKKTVAIIAGTLLPYLAARDRRLLKPTSEKLRDGEIEIENEDEEDEEHVEMERIREMVQQWKAEAAREGRPLKLPTSKVFGHHLVN